LRERFDGSPHDRSAVGVRASKPNLVLDDRWDGGFGAADAPASWIQIDVKGRASATR